MEVPGGPENKLLVCLYEFLGTALLLIGINLTQGSNIGIGLILVSALSLYDRVSGGHFNPALTIGVFIKEGKVANLLLFAMIIVSQILGATLGVFVAYGCQYLNKDSNTLVPGIAVLCPNQLLSKDLCTLTDGKAAISCLIAETTATFVLVSVILGVKYYHQGPNEIKFFLIGLTLCGLITAIGPITGASINPAVGLV